MRIMIFAVLLITVSLPTIAEDVITSAWFQNECKDDSFTCVIYASGFYGGHRTQLSANDTLLKSAEMPEVADFVRRTTTKIVFGCIPIGVTNGQVAQVWLKYLDENPQVLHLAPEITLPTSIKEAFPCEN